MRLTLRSSERRVKMIPHTLILLLMTIVAFGAVVQDAAEGVMSMNIGGKRMLFIPPELGYGSRGAGNVIPPHAPLIFEVELLDIRK
ncbi:MAG TPA: hypothetical protein EYM55_03910 [Candidatus Marinimicrobia bacterium]|nr:hypothetical protein [Candidatus Neomarinimicrobiota bacterium]